MRELMNDRGGMGTQRASIVIAGAILCVFAAALWIALGLSDQADGQSAGTAPSAVDDNGSEVEVRGSATQSGLSDGRAAIPLETHQEPRASLDQSTTALSVTAVESDSNLPMPNVEIRGVDDQGAEVLLGVTDSNGTVTAPVAAGLWYLDARTPSGRVGSTEAEAEAGKNTSAKIRLKDGVRLSGVCVAAGTGLPVEDSVGILVNAYRLSTPAEAAVDSAVVGTEGRFVFESIEPGVAHVLSATSATHVGTQGGGAVIEGADADVDGIEVTVAPVFVGLLQLRDDQAEDGRATLVEGERRAPYVVVDRELAAAWQPLGYVRFPQLQPGPLQDYVDEAFRRGDLPIAGRFSDGRVEPLVIEVRLPGYRECVAFVSLEPFGSIQPPVTVVDLERSVEGFGSILIDRLAFDGLCHTARQAGTLTLVPANRGDSNLYFDLPLDFVDEPIVNGVPAGLWHWSFYPGTTRYPSLERNGSEWPLIDVHPDRLARISPTFPEGGRVVARVTDEGGRPYFGPLALSFRSLPPDANVPESSRDVGLRYSWRHSPYIADRVPAGRYSVDLAGGFLHHFDGALLEIDVGSEVVLDIQSMVRR